MNIYVLVVYMYGTGIGFSQEFNSAESCIKEKDAIDKIAAVQSDCFAVTDVGGKFMCNRMVSRPNGVIECFVK